MPLSLLSPLPLLHSFSPTKSTVSRIRATQSRLRLSVVKATSEKGSSGNVPEDDPSFNPFGFVTDNPSSRSAIQLPESPAEDGNVGQMLYRTEDKGREFGSTIKVGKLRWFVRETGSKESRRGTVVFLHGAPTQSFSYRTVMSEMSEFGFHCYAPDWIGFGFSDKPQPGYGFNYTGNPSKVEKIAILNTPLTVSSPVPGLFKQLRIPLFGEFTCQNAILAERFIEGGSPYVLKNEKADVYRLPYLSSGGPGFALLETAKKINFGDTLGQIANGFSSGSWDKPTLLAWGIADKYLSQSIAEEFEKQNPQNVKLQLIEGAGHLPQEDWPERVVAALRSFF
ncbi:hypothetical protein F2Q69_00047283 [Brassica cretica]|uniref:Serine aminopeptidase S33 domain-containing protein n=1 Tax=Brassica cretica TaxID=69181 RepID=A0A8S9PYF5_BRACR|nr:hypothetical protein F2Q69_00047283 [Brassica cretica]